MPGLGVPFIQMLAHFVEEGDPYGFAAKCEHAPREIEEVENVKILSGCEGPADPLVNRQFFIWPRSRGGEQDFGYVALPGFMQSAFNISKGDRSVLHLDSENKLSRLVETLEVCRLTSCFVAGVDASPVDLSEYAEVDSNRIEKSARKGLCAVAAGFFFKKFGGDTEGKV